MSVFDDPRWLVAKTQWPGWRATRIVESAWLGHIPFAHWIVAAAQPETIVELGTMRGPSFAAFCESAVRSGLPTKCWAVDHWEGDPHASEYGEDIFADAQRFFSTRYPNLGNLIRKSFDDALADFKDGSIDLLHIDGFHTYEAVSHDFTSWKPKLSSRAIVLFHDITERRPGFGVYRFWDEISGFRQERLKGRLRGSSRVVERRAQAVALPYGGAPQLAAGREGGFRSFRSVALLGQTIPSPMDQAACSDSDEVAAPYHRQGGPGFRRNVDPAQVPGFLRLTAATIRR